MKDPVLVIMAAGLGSRFGGLKQITPITNNNEIILDFSLYDAYRAGFKEAILVIKEEYQKDFEEKLSKASKYINIKYCYQKMEDIPSGYEVPSGRTKPFGTAHAMLSARDFIDGPFVVINSDDFYGLNAFKEIFNYLKEYNGYSMVGYNIENTLTENGTVSRGVCEVKDNHLVSIKERLKLGWNNGEIIDIAEEPNVKFSKGTPVSLNFWGFSKDFMDEAKDRLKAFMDELLGNTNTNDYIINGRDPIKSEFALPNLVFKVMKDKNIPVRVLNTSDKWYGVTYKEDLVTIKEAIENMKKDGLYPEVLFK